LYGTISGDKESGKTTLIAKLQGNEDPKKGSGLEYGYIDVRDEYRDGMYRYISKMPSILPLPPILPTFVIAALVPFERTPFLRATAFLEDLGQMFARDERNTVGSSVLIKIFIKFNSLH
jgi:GTPase SAR1 family protein